MTKIGTLAVFLLFLGSIAVAQGMPEPAAPDRPAAPSRERMRERRFPGVAGTIQALKDDAMTLKTSDGRIVTVKLTHQTGYRREGQPAKLADFKLGEMVMVRGEATGESTWTAQTVVTRSRDMGEFREGLGKRFIAGEIKSVEGAKLTILRTDGQTQTIEVDENTSFRKQGESVTLADLKPGDHVFGRGEVKGGVFRPAVLNVGEFDRMRRGPGNEGPSPR